MRILVFGAGVIGSLYGVLLAEAGYDVSVYARGRRLESLTLDGLLYKSKGKIRKAPIKVLSKLEAEDSYDLVFLTVRENQLHAALEELRQNSSPTIVTIKELRELDITGSQSFHDVLQRYMRVNQARRAV